MSERNTVRTPAYELRAAIAAILAVSLGSAVLAEELTADDLTKAQSSVQVGMGSVDTASYKYGEYNGLKDKGAYAIGNFDLRGGGAWDSSDATRWRLNGTNLGLDNRELALDYGVQGQFKLHFGANEITRNSSDSFQSPYLGTGSDVLTLPSTWLKPIVPQVSGSSINFRSFDPVTGTANYATTTTTGTPLYGYSAAPSNAQLTTLAAIRAADVPAFHNVDLSTRRERYDVGGSYNLTREWSVSASVMHEDKSGLKAMGALNAANSPASIIPDLIDQRTAQYNVRLNYAGKKAFLQAGFYGSVFTNNVNYMTFQNPLYAGTVTPVTNALISSPPDNQFHQYFLTGGFNFTPATKLVANAAWARSAQNQTFITDNLATLPFGNPAASLAGEVITKTFSLKLTSQPVKHLHLSAGWKSDDRDNKTPIATYMFQDTGEAASSGASVYTTYLRTLTGLPTATFPDNLNVYQNRPYSKKTNQGNLEADWSFLPGQGVKAAYDYQKIDRSCTGSWYNCADAPTSKENTFRAEYRFSTASTFSGRLSYTYAKRNVDYDPNAWLSLVPLAGVLPTDGTTLPTLTVLQMLQTTGLGAYGPMLPYAANSTGLGALYGTTDANMAYYFFHNSALSQALYGSRNDIHEIPGMERYNQADRHRSKARASMNWDPSDLVSVQSTFSFNKDAYPSSAYGLTASRSWAADLDLTFNVTEDVTATAFYTHEDQNAQSAGISYSAGTIANTAKVGGNALNTVVSGGCFATVTLKNQNAKIDPCLKWATDMKDVADTIGFELRDKGLAKGRLDLAANVSYSYARTDVGVTGGSYANNPLATTNSTNYVEPAVIYIPATALPEVSTRVIEFKLSATYKFDKQRTVYAGYSIQHLTSDDYAYQGMQFGTLSSVLPTNEKAPSYTVQSVGLAFTYSFH